GPAAAGPAARVRLLLLAWAVLSLLLLLYWTSQATGSQGRLLFPGLSAFAVLLVGGLEVWLDYLPRGRRWARAALPGLLLAATCWALAVLLPHAYHAPGPVAASPAPALPLDLRYGHDAQLRLDAITLPATRFRPGESVPVTLYERAPEAVDQDYRLFIQLLDNERNVLGNVTTHPGWGRNPTTLWRANALYPDAYRVQIQEDIDPRSPLLATVYAGFIDPAAPAGSEDPLPAADGAAAAVTPFLGNVVIEPLHPPDDAGLTPLAVQFGDVIELKGMDAPAQAAPGASIPVRLLWRGLGPPAADYIAFVHLRSPGGERVAGFDAPPGQGRFPTGYWQAGDEILSEFALDLPEGLAPGVYDVWIGLYAADSGGTLRLPVTREDDRLTGDGEVLAGTVAVE
ncbi:MAG: hypothetical protein KDD92_03210, partial [Caldilineaceae bacterium]|nr:hypothetical protein [Caldilineaceae bacterium]